MITGVHAMLYSKDADADRAFFRDVLKLSHVDAGQGWLIFKMPPTEMGIHPGEDDGQDLYLMCDDLDRLIAEVAKAGATCSPPRRASWGLATMVTLPSGTTLKVYQPDHARP